MFNVIHPDLIAAQKLAYGPSWLSYKNLIKESESQEYGACTFEINNRLIKFRVAKKTPTKTGQFVTFWKRIGSGRILPYDVSDLFDVLVVSVRDDGHFGQFVFPRSVLCEKDFISKEGEGGKRAMRVYPPWDITENQQAKKTQAWQLLYFFEMDQNKPVDVVGIKKLFLV